MPNPTIHFPGKVNNAGSQYALAFRAFSGEVIAAFEEANLARNLLTTKTIPDGAKSAVFHKFGKATSKRYEPGQDLMEPSNGYLQTINKGEIEVFVDKPMISPAFLTDWDKIIMAYDDRAPISTAMGRVLAEHLDKALFAQVITAARSADVVTGAPSGTSIVLAMTNAATIQAALIAAAENFASKNVPMDNLVCVMRPATYYLWLAGTPTAINLDYGNSGNGSLASGKIDRFSGIKIYMSNHLPNTNLGTGATFTQESPGANNSGYYPDATNTTCLVFAPDAVAVAAKREIAIRADEIPQNRGTLVSAEYVMGASKYIPACAYEIKSA